MASQYSGASIPQPASGPYIPTTWGLGGTSKVSVDVPITAVLLALYITGAAIHMTIFQMNRRRGHKFIFSAVLFGFCMSRTVTTILRIASTCLPHNIRLAIAAQIFLAAGVLLLFVINLLFAQRIMRSLHPRIGWHKTLSLFFKALYVLIVLSLIMVITVTVQSFYTLRKRTRQIDRDIQLYAATFFMIVSLLPFPIVLLSLAIPSRHPAPPLTRQDPVLPVSAADKPSRTPSRRLSKRTPPPSPTTAGSPAPYKAPYHPRAFVHQPFGQGTLKTKVTILLLATLFVSLGATYRCATSWYPPVPRARPLPGYYHKACLYIFDFAVEIVVVYLYALLRVDRRFHVPDGASRRRHYFPPADTAAEEEAEVGGTTTSAAARAEVRRSGESDEKQGIQDPEKEGEREREREREHDGQTEKDSVGSEKGDGEDEDTVVGEQQNAPPTALAKEAM